MVVGLNPFKKKMRRIPVKIKVRMRKANIKSVEAMVKTAKGFVPDPAPAGKYLNDSITWSERGDADAPSEEAAEASGLRAASGADSHVVYFTAGNERAFYAGWREHGTVKMTAQPYFFPAYRAHQKAHKSRMSREIRKGIKEGVR